MSGSPRQSSFQKARITGSSLQMWKIWYALRAILRRIRVTRTVTDLLGPQYVRSRSLLELDITYACNLHCYNCNRSVRQAPSSLHMPVERLQGWINEWIERKHRWKRIRVLGGEPTVHPEFERIVDALLRYRDWSPSTVIEIVTNGHGSLVNAKINQLPSDIWIENSLKTTVVQDAFAPFNLAPVDDPAFRKADFSNGCAIASGCGMGLTPLGYYPCALAGGIDRITGESLGRQNLPDDADDMLSVTSKSCRLCGRFRDGHFVPHSLRPRLVEEKISPTWHRLYDQWKIRQTGVDDKHGHPG